MSLDFFHYTYNYRNSKPAYFQHNYISENETDQEIVSEYDQEIPQSLTADIPLDTERKSHTTITRHQENKLSKPTSSPFPIKMTAKLECHWTKHRTITESHNRSNNKRSTTTEPPPLSGRQPKPLGGGGGGLMVSNLRPRFCCC